MQWSRFAVKPFSGAFNGFQGAAHRPIWALTAVICLAAVDPARAEPPVAAPAAVAPAIPERPLLPKPAAPSKAEIEHFERLDKATESVRNYDISAADAVLVRDSVAAIRASNRSKGAGLQAQIKDPVGRKLPSGFA